MSVSVSVNLSPSVSVSVSVSLSVRVSESVSESSKCECKFPFSLFVPQLTVTLCYPILPADSVSIQGSELLTMYNVRSTPFS